MRLLIETKKREVCKTGTGSIFFAYDIVVNNQVFKTFYDEESLKHFIENRSERPSNVSKWKRIKDILWMTLDCILYTLRK